MTSALADDPVTLRNLAAQADEALATADPHEVVAWAVDTFGPGLVATTSMGDGVLSHLCASVAPGLDVVFLDTGYHFPETIGTRDAVAARYDINVINVLPILSVNEQDAAYGPRLYERDPDACCQMRKVAPLNQALEPYTAWISGVRRDDSATRAHTAVVSYDEKRGKVAIHPFATWTQAQIDEYVADNEIYINPLVDEGYTSIGCGPCTRAVLPGEDARAGRWSGSDKSECGIHS